MAGSVHFILMQMNRSLRKGNFDPFFLKAFEYSVAHFILDKILIHKFPHLTNEGKIKRGLSKTRDESNVLCLQKECLKSLQVYSAIFA